MDDIRISNDHSLLQLDTIYRFMSQSYWANKRTAETIKKSVDGSLCYGVYRQKEQIGFARVITDHATMYWLCDVYIAEEFRGRGIGKQLIETIVYSDEMKNLFGYLGTLDAHELYEQYDFLHEPDKVMMRKPDFLRGK